MVSTVVNLVSASIVLITIAYWVTSSIAFYIAFNKALWRGNKGWVLIGIGYMLLAVIIQIVLQQIPTLILVIRKLPSIILGVRSVAEVNTLILNMLKPYIPWLALYMGFMAGLCQETARYFAVKDREPASALYIGYGFALIDITVGILTFLINVLMVAHVDLTTIPSGIPLQVLLITQYVGIAIQPLVSFLFHPGASMFLRYMQANKRGLTGLAINIATHTYIDSFLLYLNNALLLGLITNISTITALLAIYFTTIITTAIVLFLTGLNRIRLFFH